MKQIYLAGSFAHKGYVRNLAEKIRFYGHTVYCFCDENELAFRLSEKIREYNIHKTFTPQTALDNPDVRRIGLENWERLKHVDIVIVALPCGKSAHLEAGWAKGKDKKVYVFGTMYMGEFDAMYVMCDGVFDDDEFIMMMDTINTIE